MFLIKFLKLYRYVSLGVFAVFGLLLIFAAFGSERLLSENDVLFGVTNRVMLVVAGALYLAVSCALFLNDDSLVGDLLAFWMGLNCLAYRAGMIWMNVPAPYSTAQLVGWKTGLGPDTVNVLWNLFTIYLVMVGILILMLEWRIRTRPPDVKAEV
jgi:hypothetical protein